ncbi:hypothetical protein V2J09_003527 [Rumex salicifolius]
MVTAVYLINRLPTPILQYASPYSKLLNTTPDYHKLKCFGCLCYPWLRPYANHKLAPKSVPCVFIGYASDQHAALCLDPTTGRVYTSRHIRFLEESFPFKDALTSQPPACTSNAKRGPLKLPILSPVQERPTNPTNEAHSSANSAAPSPTQSSSPTHSLSIIPSNSPPQQHTTRSSSLPQTTQPTTQIIGPLNTAIQPSPTPQTHPPSHITSTNPNKRQKTAQRVVTRSQNQITKPIAKLNLHTHTNPTTEPHTITQALRDPEWRRSMQMEFDALTANATWDLVPPDPGQNLVGNKWIYRIKHDIIITGSCDIALSSLVETLANRFALKDLGTLNYFLGVEVVPSATGLFLSQRKYILDLLHKSGMGDAKSVPTPLSVGIPLKKNDGDPLPCPIEYRTLVGSLQYLSLTRPDIAFPTNKLAQFLQNPTTVHWTALRHVLRYLVGTLDTGIYISSTSPLTFKAYSDADWAGDKDDYVSTTGYVLYLGSTPVSWSSRKQKSIARSSTEAEYKALADTSAEVLWVLSLLGELGHTPPAAPVIYCDNLGATNLSANPVFHSRMKHIAIAYHFIREQVQSGKFRVSFVSTHDQLADLLTKPLHRPRFATLLLKLNLQSRPSNLRERISND